MSDITPEQRARLEALLEKRAPVQGFAPGIPWSMHLRAYAAYCKKWSPQPALIDLEGRNCRGGFGTEELDDFIPGWREQVGLAEWLKDTDDLRALLTSHDARGERIEALKLEIAYLEAENNRVQAYLAQSPSAPQSTRDTHETYIDGRDGYYCRHCGARWKKSEPEPPLPCVWPPSAPQGEGERGGLTGVGCQHEWHTTAIVTSAGERQGLRCAKCGVTREWSAPPTEPDGVDYDTERTVARLTKANDLLNAPLPAEVAALGRMIAAPKRPALSSPSSTSTQER